MSGQLQAPAALPLGKEPLVPIGEEAGWAQSQSERCGENFLPYRDTISNPLVVQHIASRYTDCAVIKPRVNGRNNATIG
jgi:hypothetical protein